MRRAQTGASEPSSAAEAPKTGVLMGADAKSAKNRHFDTYFALQVCGVLL